MHIERYTPQQKSRWDTFIKNSRNGSFLFYRDYMDYHQDRFKDHSLLIFSDANDLLAVLPANQAEDILWSHQGLTYGGLVTGDSVGAAVAIDIFMNLKKQLGDQGLKTLRYKAVPSIYYNRPGDEDRYGLFRVGAQLYRRDITFVVIPNQRLPFQKRRDRGAQKALAQRLICKPSQAYADFWEILEWNLKTQHQASPVHSIDEILSLAAKFPENIKLFSCHHNGTLLAGAVIYENRSVAHAQYIASSEEGRTLGALDLLFTWLIREVYIQKPYFDFGIATEAEGNVLNAGLAEFKEGFGASAIACDFYELTISK